MKTGQFIPAQFPVLPPFQLAETQRSVTEPFEFHDLVTDSGEQPADLPVLPFRHHDLDPGAVLLLFDRGRAVYAELPFSEEQPLPQLFIDLRTWSPRHLSEIGPENAIAGMGQLLGQITIIRDDQQPGRVFVQPPDGKQTGSLFREEIQNEPASFRVICRTQITAGLVEHKVFFTLDFQTFSIQRDSLGGRIHRRSQTVHHFPVDRHPTGGNQFFTIPPGSKTTLGQKTLQAHRFRGGDIFLLSRHRHNNNSSNVSTLF